MLSPRLAMVAVTSLRSPGRSGATTVTSAVPPPSTTTHSTLALCEPSLSLQARKRVHSPLSLPPAAAQRRVGREWGAHARGALAQPVEPHKARNARGTGRQAGSCNAKPMAASSSVHIRVSLCSRGALRPPAATSGALSLFFKSHPSRAVRSRLHSFGRSDLHGLLANLPPVGGQAGASAFHVALLHGSSRVVIRFGIDALKETI